MIFEGSRYVKSQLLLDEVNDIAYLDINNVEFKVREDDTYYQINKGDRLDILANRIYSNPQLNWVFLAANPQYLSELDINVGDIIRVPSLNHVKEVILDE